MSGEGVRVVASGFSFLEAPRWHDGQLYLSDFYTHRVLRVDPGGTVTTVCTVPGQPSGLGFDPDGELLVVSMLDRRLLRVVAGQLEDVADLTDVTTGTANDMVVDRSGRAYVGNFGRQLDGDRFEPTNLARVDPDGSTHIAAVQLDFPNGMAITGDGNQLIVAETFASRITIFDIATDGALHDPRVWAVLAPRDGRAVLPDGLALDAEGCLWVADAAGSGPLWMRDGEVVERIDTGDLAVYAVALGGPDGSTLFMCAAPPLGRTDPTTTRNAVLLACDVKVPA